MDILPFIQAFVLLIVIMDPLVSTAAFISMTNKMGGKEKHAVATKAVLVAAVPLFLFIAGGSILLDILKVDISTFRAAGGLILILLGMQLSMGISLRKKKEDVRDMDAAAAVIGTPLITGPATIATAIILSNDFGRAVTAGAGLAALLVVWITLLASTKAYRLIGQTGIRILSTMMGLITIAWGMSFIKEGLFS